MKLDENREGTVDQTSEYDYIMLEQGTKVHIALRNSPVTLCNRRLARASYLPFYSERIIRPTSLCTTCKWKIRAVCKGYGVEEIPEITPISMSKGKIKMPEEALDYLEYQIECYRTGASSFNKVQVEAWIAIARELRLLRKLLEKPSADETRQLTDRLFNLSDMV